jgi:hypothetical protein
VKVAQDPKLLAAFSARAAEIFASRPATLTHGDCRGDNHGLAYGSWI